MSKPIKSSVELAMEKMAKLPRLTEEEIRERREREYGPLGESIARRFLMGALAETRLEAQLSEYEGDRGAIVREAFSAFLCRSIDLEDAEITAKVLGAVRVLVRDERVEQAAHRLEEILRDYQHQRQQARVGLEEEEGARLRDLGISGSAIRLDLRESERWRRISSELRGGFRPRVEQIGRELTEHLLSSLEQRS